MQNVESTGEADEKETVGRFAKVESARTAAGVEEGLSEHATDGEGESRPKPEERRPEKAE